VRRIHKQPEPHSLVAHRATPGADFDGCNKADLRAALADEQRGLCCYCCARIVATHDGMKIEHFLAQSVDPSKALSYGNLLGVCLGGVGGLPHLQHCDTRRGNRPVEFNPADSQRDVQTQIILSADGALSSVNATFDGQLHATLGLNLEHLKIARQRQIKAVATWWRDFHKRQHRRPNRQEIHGQIARLEPLHGDLVPFQFAAVWWLNNKVAS
jgi:uncharacterized protein (TIGR02646 family)